MVLFSLISLTKAIAYLSRPAIHPVSGGLCVGDKKAIALRQLNIRGA
ncbi:MAG: hypothetical protein F6K28_27645 [Microcoleus sp. SIO2G3]|nr:hypothetical protein [Microcoleus sp. SIO2G3]